MADSAFDSLLVHSASVDPPKDGLDDHDLGTHRLEWATASVQAGAALLQPRGTAWRETSIWRRYPEATHVLYVNTQEFDLGQYGNVPYRVRWTDSMSQRKTAISEGPAELIEDPSAKAGSRAHHWEVPLREVFLAAEASG